MARAWIHLFLVLLAPALLVQPAAAGVKADEPVHVVLFHINDLHARIDQLAKVAWLVGQERAKNRDVLLLNAGDNFSGNPVVDQFKPKGLPILELFNHLGLNVIELGNHEFDYGQEILKSHMQKAKYRFVCANLRVEGGQIPQPPPYVILKTGSGVQIAVLGLIQIAADTGIPDTHPEKIKGIRCEDPIAAARRYVFLKKKYPVFIALTHIGFDQDVLLARALPELDVIVGGHSHTAVADPREFGGMLIVQAGSNGRYLGRIDLTIEKGRLVSKKAVLIDQKTVSGEDADVKKMIAVYNDNPELNRVIAETGVILKGKDELGSLMTDAITQVLGLEIAFQNNGGIRLDELPPVIRLKTVYQLDPFGDMVVRFSLMPAEMRSLIHFAFAKGKAIDLQVSGLQYTVIKTPEGLVKDIILQGKEGAPLDENRKYAVGLSSYLASAYTFDHRDSGTSLFLTTSDCLIRFLEKKPDLSRYQGIVRARVRVENQPQPRER